MNFTLWLNYGEYISGNDFEVGIVRIFFKGTLGVFWGDFFGRVSWGVVEKNWTCKVFRPWLSCFAHIISNLSGFYFLQL